MKNDKVQQALATVGDAIGKGILAGLVGTAAITISQMIEMQLTKRQQSSSPATVAGQVLGVVPSDKEEASELKGEPVAPDKTNKEVKEEHTARFTQMIHWQYGTSWGMPRGLLSVAGVTGCPATAIHFAAVWGAAQVILPAANASEPITNWTPKQIATDVFHHSVYAIAAGLFYDYINKPHD
ncbi:hypothetical protein [Pontibacter harenae]|uniref:hypothetical protein n=1 Tax=Pontibacter harenae TaxID=2894083 RepID=UPI001E39C535|nr:hypothetical protein [Pontibacter harenae]MCC9165485.1 hypothetical protein [Pontibacter harenae]